MNHITSVRDALPVCDAMGSEVRIEILETILKNKAVNLDTLAKTLHLTNGALTAHIKKLSDAGRSPRTRSSLTSTRRRSRTAARCFACLSAVFPPHAFSRTAA